MPRGGVRTQPKRKRKIADQNDTSLPRCLGWCGSRRFIPRFKNDRYCVPCSREKAKREQGLSLRQEQQMGHAFSVPEGYYLMD